MKINSKNLIQADQAIDRKGFMLSIFSNWVDLSLKIGIKAWQILCPEKLKEARKIHPNSHYWEYLENKSWSKCLILSIPIPLLTNWIAGKLDSYNVEKAKRVLECADVCRYQQAKESYANLNKGIETIPNEQGADKVRWAAKTLTKDREYMMAKVRGDQFSSEHFDIADIALLYDREFLIHALRYSSIESSDRFDALRKSAPEYVAECQMGIEEDREKDRVAIALKDLRSEEHTSELQSH